MSRHTPASHPAGKVDFSLLLMGLKSKSQPGELHWNCRSVLWQKEFAVQRWAHRAYTEVTDKNRAVLTVTSENEINLRSWMFCSATLCSADTKTDHQIFLMLLPSCVVADPDLSQMRDLCQSGLSQKQVIKRDRACMEYSWVHLYVNPLTAK